MGKPAYFVTIDQRRGLALIKGRNGVKDMLSSLGVNFGWSPSKRGWFCGAEHVPDVEAYALSRGEYAVVHGGKPRNGVDPDDAVALAAAERVLREAGMLP